MKSVNLGKMHQLRCSYIILCYVWIVISVGADMVKHDIVSRWNVSKFVLCMSIV